MSRLHCSSVCLDDPFFPQDYRPVNAMLWSCTGWKAAVPNIYWDHTGYKVVLFRHEFISTSLSSRDRDSCLTLISPTLFVIRVLSIYGEVPTERIQSLIQSEMFHFTEGVQSEMFQKLTLDIYLPLHVQIPTFLISYFTATSQCESSGISECV